MKPGSQEVAVIGAGVAGLTCAHLLSPKHRVSLYEKNAYLGGHTNTIVIEDGPDAGTPVDTGFIVFNDRCYPAFTRLLESLGVSGRDSDMSFGCSSERHGVAYSSYVPNGLFAQRKDLFRPAHYRMISDILRFNAKARKDLETGYLDTRTLGAYAAEGKYSEAFMNFYLLPMGGAIWSTPTQEMMEFPAATFARFFKNHGLLDIKGRPRWKSVLGGSHSYVKVMMERFKGKVEKDSPVRSIRRTGDKVWVRTDAGEKEYDQAIVATHADEALNLLADPTSDEKRLLGAWRYTRNATVLHTDTSVMPANRRAWASWNYSIQDADPTTSPVSLTYHMNRLQGLRTQREYFVTLNRQKPVLKSSIIREISYTHPCYTFSSVKTQPELGKLNGAKRTFFCGSYFFFGFHEDAVKAAAQVCAHFGVTL